jgi:signal transduction histidine kinase
MLLASQIEAGGYTITKEEVDLTNLMQECVHEFATRFPDRKIESNIQQDIYFLGDRLLLQMAVNNLLDNAIKYSQRNSKVCVELKAEDEIAISITDEGKGIADEEKEKVFYKFYRIGNMHTRGAKGTGLGLFLTKKIVEQHKGSIIVSNNNPLGSIFVIRFKKI